MTEAARQAAARGLHVIALMDPLCPRRISHVVIPAHGIGLLSGRRGPTDQGEWLDAERLFQTEAGAEKEQGFDRNAYELLLQRATNSSPPPRSCMTSWRAITWAIWTF